MIYEITGQPGHGKTLYGLKLALDFKAQGREVYAHGIRGLKYDVTGFIPLDDPKAWQDVPDGSVVVIDECYSAFPNRNAATKVPDYIEPLARHRHRGLDIILIHQQPDQVDPFVRGLVDTHHHVRRKFGFNAAVIKTWDYSTPKPIKDAPLRAPMWRYEKRLYELYESATMHTVQRKVPWQLYVVLPLLAFVVWAGWRLMSGGSFDAVAAETPSAAPPAPASAGVGGGVLGGGQRIKYHSVEDYVVAHTPRIAELPWSAPVFDQRQVASKPELYCMASGAGPDANGNAKSASCTCMTEQGTPYALPDNSCRMLAVKGRPYNPYKEREQSAQGQGLQARAGVSAAHGDASKPGAIMAAPQIGAYGDLGITPNPGANP